MMNYKIIDPKTTFIESGVILGNGVIVGPNVTITGRTAIGDDTIIDSNTVIKNSVIGKNNFISSSVIEDGNIIGNDNRIGPYSHIKEDNAIGHKNEIGSFVEIKKSTIGSNNNIKHLAYLGDVKLGSNINIGAGVVFANYNSKKKTKEKTYVEDGVSIGSNSTVVAPVTIEKNSIIGAGTVVDKDVKNDSLVLSKRDNVYKEKYYIEEKKSNPAIFINDIILKKKNKESLTYEQLDFAFNGYLKEEITDYQMSSLLMAICINGLNDEEVLNLTDIFIKSGEVLNFNEIEGIKVDKHSTGGIGDKTTLVVAPIVASLGIPMIKMSGRGLGYTGGTIDKLESIPNIKLDLSYEEIKKQVKDINMVICSQSEKLAPMDKKIYALRDVSGTVESIPLIAVSIMSKKIALGADKILIDIKVGNGALIKTETEARELSRLMILIGNKYGKEVKTITSDMNTPLGYCIGNALEVIEAMNILQNREHNFLTELCIELSAHLVSMAKNVPYSIARNEVLQVLRNGKAYSKFLEFVKAQHGDINALKLTSKKTNFTSNKEGIIKKIDALEIGKFLVMLGAGRSKKEDSIDYSAGIKLNKLLGEYIRVNESLCDIYTKKEIDPDAIARIFTIE